MSKFDEELAALRTRRPQQEMLAPMEAAITGANFWGIITHNFLSGDNMKHNLVVARKQSEMLVQQVNDREIMQRTQEDWDS